MSYPQFVDNLPGYLTVIVGDSASEGTTLRIAATMRIFRETIPAGIRDFIVSYASILIVYDHTVVRQETLAEHLQRAWEATATMARERAAFTVEIPVVYGDEFGEDLANVADVNGLSVHEVITLHVATRYVVGAVGFAPGFTYLIGLPPELVTPRRTSPRLRVPAGSIGIGGSQTGIYALPSAGGWNLIGRTPERLVDVTADPPVRFAPGDAVQFRAIPAADFAEEPSAAAVGPTGEGPIEIISPGFQTTVQDQGRWGYGNVGFAVNGAADRGHAALANALVGNDRTHAVLEMTLVGSDMRFHRRLLLGLAGADLGARVNGRPWRPGSVREVMPGDELRFGQHAGRGARAYLSVRGGFAVAEVLGSRSTDLTAGIGGWQGRPLVAGDRLPIGDAEPGGQGIPTRPIAIDLDAPFRIVPGPDRERFDDDAWNRLVSDEFTVSSDADRVGIRLHGPELTPTAAADVLSQPIVTGSIQVTGDGQAIVMLPGHATIGGYTRIAIVVEDDWDRLGQLAPGDAVRFSAAARW